MFRIGPVIIDSLLNENVNFNNEVTSKGVEDGSSIADNIKHNPLKLTATCVLAGESAKYRYLWLKYLANSDMLVTYYGSLEPVLYNMAIESVSNKRDVSYGDGFEFDINLMQVNIARTKTFQHTTTQTTKADPATGNKVEVKVKNGGKKQVEKQKIDEESIRSDGMRKKINDAK